MGQSNEQMYEQEAAAAAAQESTYDFGDFPDDLRAKTSENNGEVAMSLEETNRCDLRFKITSQRARGIWGTPALAPCPPTLPSLRLTLFASLNLRRHHDLNLTRASPRSILHPSFDRIRAKLGMKPLRSGESERVKAQRETEEKAHVARLEAEKEKETEAIAAKIAEAKERRLMESRNRATKQLGEQDDDDDLAAWVQKSRKIEQRRKQEERRKAEELARKLAEQDEDAEDDSDDDDMFGGGEGGGKRKAVGGYSSKDLAGLKVQHNADEIMEGETMILTLKDSSILDDTRGAINEDTDELENVLLAENKRRKKARTEATKKSATPFGEEEEGGKTVLSKYDEKEEDEALTLDGMGGVSEAEQKRKEEIRRKLAASLGGAPATAKEESAVVEKKSIADFMTASEVAEAAAAKFNKPKKRRKKKLREKKLDVAELEADALAPGSSELGSRRRREEEGGGAVAAAAKAERAEKDDRFARAMNKAKMKTDEKILAEMAGDIGGEEEDDELVRALARSRRLAAKGATKGEETIVAHVTAQREKNGPHVAGGAEGITGLDGDDEGGGSVVFSDMQEFIHGINIEDRRRSAGAGPSGGAGASEMPAIPPPPPGSDVEMPAVPPPPPTFGDDNMDIDDHDGMPPPPPPPPPRSSDVQDEQQSPSNLGGIGERSNANKGLAATLALLKDTGKLNENEMWDGRTNDKKPLALQRVKEASELSSGEFEGHKFDFRLDRFDEFGRKMTPKEAFRELCHRFHGIEPSKNKKDKRLKAYQEEIKAKKARDGDTPLSSMDKMKQVQAMQASPYVVLSGTIHAGQTSDAYGAYATAGMDQDEDEGGKPGGAVGGLGAAVNGLPELKGKKKVEFMMKKR